ncbi:hypothetical protein EBR66_05395 [bacterium]|nr:hypothetical protein [bacterium]
MTKTFRALDRFSHPAQTHKENANCFAFLGFVNRSDVFVCAKRKAKTARWGREIFRQEKYS